MKVLKMGMLVLGLCTGLVGEHSWAKSYYCKGNEGKLAVLTKVFEDKQQAKVKVWWGENEYEIQSKYISAFVTGPTRCANGGGLNIVLAQHGFETLHLNTWGYFGCDWTGSTLSVTIPGGRAPQIVSLQCGDLDLFE